MGYERRLARGSLTSAAGRTWTDRMDIDVWLPAYANGQEKYVPYGTLLVLPHSTLSAECFAGKYSSPVRYVTQDAPCVLQKWSKKLRLPQSHLSIVACEGGKTLGASKSNQTGFSWQLQCRHWSTLGDDQNDVVIYSRRDVHKHPRTIVYSVLFGSTDIRY